MRNTLPYHIIGSVRVRRNNDLRTILINEETSEIMVAFTQKEYQLFLLLLRGEMVDDETLVKELFATNILDAHIKKNLSRHIDRVKLKLRASTLNIRRVHLEGYMLVTGQENILAS